MAPGRDAPSAPVGSAPQLPAPMLRRRAAVHFCQPGPRLTWLHVLSYGRAHQINSGCCGLCVSIRTVNKDLGIQHRMHHTTRRPPAWGRSWHVPPNQCTPAVCTSLAETCQVLPPPWRLWQTIWRGEWRHWQEHSPLQLQRCRQPRTACLACSLKRPATRCKGACSWQE